MSSSRLEEERQHSRLRSVFSDYTAALCKIVEIKNPSPYQAVIVMLGYYSRGVLISFARVRNTTVFQHYPRIADDHSVWLPDKKLPK